MAIDPLGEFYDPISDVRRHQVTLTVTCAVPHMDEPAYLVTISVPDLPAGVTLVTDVNPLRVAFEPAACLDTTTNTATVTNNLTVFVAPLTEAFTEFTMTVNATLVRERDDSAVLAGDEGTVGFTVGYVPGLAVDVPMVQVLLRDGAADIRFTASNRANGPTRVAAEVVDAPAELKVTLPEPFELARDASQEASIGLASLPECPQRFREITVRFVGTSPTNPEMGESDKTAGISLECIASSGKSPAPSPAILLAATAVLAALGRRRGGR